MLALLATALLAAAPEDHLLPEKGMYADYGLGEYERAVANLLLLGPRRELQMVVLPSFSVEEAVFVAQDHGKPTLVAVRAKPGVWQALSDQQEADAQGKPYRTGGKADAETLAKLKLGHELATAPLSQATYEVLKRVWKSALLDTHPTTAESTGTDGEMYHFADWNTGTGYWSGWVWTPSDATRMGKLVRLGTAMLELARAPADKRAVLDAALRKQAETWLR